MSKPITAMALIKLLGQGVFTLDTAVCGLLNPTFPLLPGHDFENAVAELWVKVAVP